MTASLLPDADESAQSEAMGIASTLVRARSERGMTQADLAEQSGISRSTIKAYESGRNMPGSRELRALSKVLRVSPNVLIFGTETPFSDESPNADTPAGVQLMLGDPEDAKRARMRLAGLADLLTADEVAALLRLTTSLATARHGAEIVSRQLVGADLVTAMGVAFQEAGRNGSKVPPDLAALMEASMERGGNKTPTKAK